MIRLRIMIRPSDNLNSLQYKLQRKEFIGWSNCQPFYTMYSVEECIRAARQMYGEVASIDSPEWRVR